MFHKPVSPGSEITVELLAPVNLGSMLVTLRSRVYIGETMHYEVKTKIGTFESI